jgi:L-ascorbate metabolism protein UlaG (beta-lactamase superfamily)
LHITWLGQGGYLFELASKRLAVDPYLSDSLAAKGVGRLFPAPVTPEELRADFIICTHDHADHFDPDTVLPAKAAHPETEVIGPSSVASHGKELGLSVRTLASDEADLQLGPFTIRAVQAHHSDPDAVGLLISAGGYQVYLTGDTTYTDELATIAANHGSVDLLLICINGKLGNMSAVEAAKVAADLRPKLAIPMHYGMFASNTVEPERFLEPARQAECRVGVLEVGVATSIESLMDEHRSK